MVRLRQNQIQTIRDEVQRTFGEDAVVRVFGSRVHEDERGGDIDLYIESGKDTSGHRQRVRALRHALLTRLGDQRIDIVTAPRGGKGRPIDITAREEGVDLDGIADK